MRPIQTSVPKKSLITVRSFYIALLFVLSIILSANAHASGSKMPSVGEDTEIADGSGASPEGAVTGGSTTISNEFAHLDPSKIVPKSLLAKALNYYSTNKAKVRQDLIGIIDFSQHSSKERFYIIDLQSGQVDTYQVAHGKNSDPDGDGHATKFSNVNGSEMSSQGVYVTAETYYGSKGFSLRLDGKSSTNSNARSRAVVIHPADYVQSGEKAGRSWGCPALDTRYSEEVINRIKEGMIIYAQ